MLAMKQFNRKVLTSAITTAIIASTQVSLTHAQDQGSASDDIVLEEVIVTATARAESTQNIPYNISAITGADIEAQNIVDSNELMRNIAGISVVDRGYRNQGHMNSIVIRGVNVDNGVNGDVGLSAVSTAWNGTMSRNGSVGSATFSICMSGWTSGARSFRTV